MKRSRFPVAALAVGGAFACAHAAQAGSTAAGTSLSNTATATYADPNNPGPSLNATSNTVSVTVAQVAGLTVAPAAVTDTTGGGSVLPGHVLNYDFLVTNVGNAPTEFAIPGAATITGPATAGALQISTDGGNTYAAVPSGGLTTAAIPEGGSVRIRQVVTVTAGAPSGAPIIVLLGNTGPNDNSAADAEPALPDGPQRRRCLYRGRPRRRHARQRRAGGQRHRADSGRRAARSVRRHPPDAHRLRAGNAPVHQHPDLRPGPRRGGDRALRRSAQLGPRRPDRDLNHAGRHPRQPRPHRRRHPRRHGPDRHPDRAVRLDARLHRHADHDRGQPGRLDHHAARHPVRRHARRLRRRRPDPQRHRRDRPVLPGVDDGREPQRFHHRGRHRPGLRPVRRGRRQRPRL